MDIPSEESISSLIVINEKLPENQTSNIDPPSGSQSLKRLSHIQTIPKPNSLESNKKLIDEINFSDKKTKLTKNHVSALISNPIEIEKEKESQNDINKDIEQESKQFRFIGKDLVGRSFHKSFLILKYRFTNDSLILIKRTQTMRKILNFF